MVDYRTQGGNRLYTHTKMLEDHFLLVSHADKISIIDQQFQITLSHTVDRKFELSVPVIPMIEEACSKIGQDGYKMMESKNGFGEFEREATLALREKYQGIPDGAETN